MILRKPTFKQGKACLGKGEYDVADLSKVKAYFSDCNHVIYTTKSHMIEKKGVTCPRFRIIVELDNPLDPLSLPSIVDWFGVVFNADTACKDGARFFFLGNSTSQIHRNFGAPVSTEWLLSLAPSQTHQDSPGLISKASLCTVTSQTTR